MVASLEAHRGLIPAGEQIYGMAAEDVRSKHSSFGPFSRHVLAKTLATNQDELRKAVQDCTLDVLQPCFANPGRAPEDMTHRLV